MRLEQRYLTQAQRNKIRRARIASGNVGTPVRKGSGPKPTKAQKKAFKKAQRNFRLQAGGTNDKSKR